MYTQIHTCWEVFNTPPNMMWHLGIWLSGRLGSIKFIYRLDDCKGLFQLKLSYDSKICKMTPVCSCAGLPSRGTQTGWRNEPVGTLQTSVKANPAPVWKPPPAMTQPGACWAGATLWKKLWRCWWAVPKQHRGPPPSSCAPVPWFS